MYPRLCTLLLFILFLQSYRVGGQTAEEPAADTAYVTNPASYVDPFLGTAPLTDPAFIGYTPPKDWRVWAGLTYPGSSLPNAMVQLSPITEYGSGAGYEYEDSTIIGFTHTNKGHWNLCNVPVLPLSGGAEYPYASRFDKATEAASPAFYGVTLTDYGVEVRLTSTLRTGYHAYTFADPTDRRLLFDLGRANNRVRDWAIAQEGEDRLSGYQDMGGEQVYFYAILSTPIRQLERSEGDDRGYAVVDLGEGGAEVSMTIGLSFTSTENARQNLEEVGDRSFDQVRQDGVDTWNQLLGKVAVAGGSERERRIFYSSLYRTFLWPALRGDANDGFDYYTKPSLWDTYRNKLVLLSMLRPQVAGDVIQSMIALGEEDGFMPTFFHGDHAAPFIANAYAQGVRNFDLDRAYELLINNAYKEGGTRPYISEYIAQGYVPEPVVENPNTETKAAAGVSKTLEYALDDYSLAQLARARDDDEHYRDLLARAGNYRNVFDPATHFMRGRLASGDWVTPFDSEYPYYEYMYREANAWQLSFYVPHDMPGLVELYGGPAPFESKLDSLFTLPWNPEHIARNISSFIGQYCHGNQPDHEAPYAYYAIGKPEKSQALIDRILSDFYAVGEDERALCGMDDAGEMSAWYVFAAAGLYPLSPADNEYLISLPVFERVRWQVGDTALVVERAGEERTLNTAELNGSPLQKEYFLPHADLQKGGKLLLRTTR